MTEQRKRLIRGVISWMIQFGFFLAVLSAITRYAREIRYDAAEELQCHGRMIFIVKEDGWWPFAADYACMPDGTKVSKP